MQALTVSEATVTPSSIDLLLDVLADNAQRMTPEQAYERLCEPKDHLPREVAEYTDDLMRWVIGLNCERVVATA